MDKQKVVEFVKTHKKEIAIATVATVGGIALYAITKKKPNIEPPKYGLFWVRQPMDVQTRINVPEQVTRSFGEAWRDRTAEGVECFAMALGKVPVGELGTVGEAYLELGELEPDTVVDVVVCRASNWGHEA